MVRIHRRALINWTANTKERWLQDVKLPNAERAFIDIEKLRNYCLNPEHPRGKNKARVFASLLGLATDDSEFLRNAILEGVHSKAAETGEQDEFGQRYTVDFQMIGPARAVTLQFAVPGLLEQAKTSHD